MSGLALKRVTVLWLDAFTDDDAWRTREAGLGKHHDHICESPGIVVRETKNYVYIAQTFGKTASGAIEFTNIVAVPRGCIVSPRRLRRP